METLEQRLRDAVANLPGIAALLLFGSRARGHARRASDLDIAVLPTSEEAERGKGLDRIEIRLATLLQSLSGHPEHRVDVVRLDQAPPNIRQSVLVDGKMIVLNDPEAWKALRLKTMREYCDQEWMRTILRRGLRRRLQEGRPSGRSEHARKPLERARRVLREA